MKLLIYNHLKVLHGRAMPRHLQIAWRRHVFRLLYDGRDCGLWLRDFPLSLFDLASLGLETALLEYHRTGQSTQFSMPGFSRL